MLAGDAIGTLHPFSTQGLNRGFADPLRWKVSKGVKKRGRHARYAKAIAQSFEDFPDYKPQETHSLESQEAQETKAPGGCGEVQRPVRIDTETNTCLL